jgi:hypothetical protein
VTTRHLLVREVGDIVRCEELTNRIHVSSTMSAELAADPDASDRSMGHLLVGARRALCTRGREAP